MPPKNVDDELDTEVEPDLEEPDLEEPDLEEPDLDDVVLDDVVLDVEDLDTDLDASLELVVAVDEGEEAEEEGAVLTATLAKKVVEDDEDDDEADPDDVEADLSAILKDRIAAADDLDEDEEEEVEPGETSGRVQPRTDGEFICSSCFLVKSVSQRVPGSKDLCSDCV
jgi:hypothetical protein